MSGRLTDSTKLSQVVNHISLNPVSFVWFFCKKKVEKKNKEEKQGREESRRKAHFELFFLSDVSRG